MTSHEMAEDDLAATFKKFNAYQFIFVEPGGNFGDDLIYWGAEFLAQQLGISFRTQSIKEFLQYRVAHDEVVYIHGGGGYNRWCSGAVIRILEHALCSKAVAVIQGPCTLEEDDDYLRDVMVPVLEQHLNKNNLYFFTRECTSLRLAKKFLQTYCVEVLTTHDTALRLNREEVLRRVGDVNGGYRLYGFRLDNESGERGFSVSRFGVRMDPAYFCRDFTHWIRVHVGAESIITNRTHSSILGSILGTDTTLFPSRYHKNRSVWEYSLKARGTKWSDGEVIIHDNVRNDLSDFLPRFLRKSYKVERMVRFCQGVPLK